MPPVVLTTHVQTAAHDAGSGHPDAPERLTGILDAVRRDDALRSDGLVRLEALAAEPEDLALAHAPAHVALVRALSARAAIRDEPYWIDPDTAISGGSFEAALASAGCAITAAERVATGGARAGFALCRPPGHHAAYDRSAGFCLFNNVVVAARRLQASGLARQILIVDLDVHHGDGTQDLLWEDPTTYYLSLHLFPHYPGTGAERERGGGPGTGRIRNVPLPPGTAAGEYRRRFSGALGEALEVQEPDFVLVSLGLDCLAGDPLGGLLLEPEDLHAVVEELTARTRSSAPDRVAAVLEGGYVPDRMGLGVVNVLRAFAGLPATATAEAHAPGP
jgi:acetoin utilization deacetylase AcuC-like enzyme